MNVGSDITVETGLTPAQAEMVAANTGLIGYLLRGKAKHLIGGTYDDVDAFQDGVFGLARAVQLFDPDRGYRFSTYALPLIFQAIQRGRGRCESRAWRNAYTAGRAAEFLAPLSLELEYVGGDGTIELGDLLPDLGATPEADAVAAHTADRLRAACEDDLDHAVLDALLAGHTLSKVGPAHGYSRETGMLRARRLRRIGAALLTTTAA